MAKKEHFDLNKVGQATTNYFRLKKLRISLDSQTPNFVACATNDVGILKDGSWYSGDSSFIKAVGWVRQSQSSDS
jgi:hypothetical protein